MIGRALPLCLLAAACALPRPEPAPPPAEPREEIPSTLEVPGDFLLRQRIRFEWRGGRGSLEAVVQKRCDELVVIGFTPFGARAWSVRQRDREVEIESRTGEAPPFSPRFVLADVHRSYLLPLPDPPPPDGVHETRRDGEIRRERWESGRLVERSFARAAGDPPGRIVVRFSPGATRGSRPARVELDNGWYGYRLEIETLASEELVCPR